MSLQSRYNAFGDPYHDGFIAGRRNIHSCDKNYARPEDWKLWLKGWREGQATRHQKIAAAPGIQLPRIKPARIVREYYARFREASA